MKINRITPIALIIVLFILASITLTACGSPPPEYGKVITETPVLATATQDATVTPEITLPPTQRPDAKEAAITIIKAMANIDAHETTAEYMTRLCGLSSEYGCNFLYAAEVEQWREKVAQKKPNGSQAVIQETQKLFENNQMSDGTEREIWHVAYQNSADKPENAAIERNVSLVWSKERQRWELFEFLSQYDMAVSVACGQTMGKNLDRESARKLALQCATATPLPPTPFVPVTPVFTPKP
jgi:hypothetical protein